MNINILIITQSPAGHGRWDEEVCLVKLFGSMPANNVQFRRLMLWAASDVASNMSLGSVISSHPKSVVTGESI